MAETGSALLEVQDLHVEFRAGGRAVKAVNGIAYTIDRGETLAILGESGSGKTVSAAALMDLIDSPPGFITGGRIIFQNQDLVALPRRERRRICGDRMAMIFQDALAALNPVYSVGWQIAEPFKAHRALSTGEAERAAIGLLQRVGIPAAKQRYGDYPHQFSGGMRQRVMIAMAIALEPDLLIADEPTTALDVTVQAQIMDLLRSLREETGMAMILITHDLGVVADIADRVAVMYAGKIVETGSVREVLRQPAHPYTLGLLQSLPQAHRKGQKLHAISGSPPDLAGLPQGCAFHPRCSFAKPLCRDTLPEARTIAPGRTAACHFTAEVRDAGR